MALTPRKPLETLAPTTPSPLLEAPNIGYSHSKVVRSNDFGQDHQDTEPPLHLLATGPPINFFNDFCLRSKAADFFPPHALWYSGPSLSPGLSLRPYTLGSLLGAPFPGLWWCLPNLSARCPESALSNQSHSCPGQRMLPHSAGASAARSLASRVPLRPAGACTPGSTLGKSAPSLLTQPSSSQPTAPHLRGGFLSCTVSMALPAAAQTASKLHPPGARPANPPTLPLSAPAGSERGPG